jgi:hypothetical protein
VLRRRIHPFLLFLILLVHVYALWMMARYRYVAPVAVAETAPRITYVRNLPLPVKPAPARPVKATASVKPQAPVTRAPVTAPVQSTQPVTAAEPVAAAEPEVHRPSAAEILEQARRDMPRIERELRKNVPTALKLSPDSFRYKLEHGIDEAFVGGDQRTVIDFYTSPDNVVYMRATRNGKSRCTMNGGPVSLRSAMGGGGGDTKVNCPPQSAGWKDTPG